MIVKNNKENLIYSKTYNKNNILILARQGEKLHKSFIKCCH